MTARHSSWLFFGTMLSTMVPAAAQTIDANTVIVPNPIYPVMDENGVNLSNTSFTISGPSLVIGNPSSGGLALAPHIVGPDAMPVLECMNSGSCDMSGFTPANTNLTAQLVGEGGRWENLPGQPLTVSSPSGVARFYMPTGALTSILEFSPRIGRTLTYSTGAPPINSVDAGERMTFQDSDGTLYLYLYDSNVNHTNKVFPILSITRPNGEVTTFNYGATSDPKMGTGLIAISTNRGYMIRFQKGGFSYNTATAPKSATDAVVGVNLAYDTCSLVIGACNLTRDWPVISGGRYYDANGWATWNPNPRVYTDVDGGITTVNVTKPSMYSPPAVVTANITRPNGRVMQVSYDYDHDIISPVSPIVNCPQAPGQVSIYSPNWNPIWTFPCPYAPVKSIFDGIGTWTYNLAFTFAAVSGSPGNYYVASTTSTRTDPNGKIRVVTALPSGQVTKVVDELGRTTSIDVQPLFDPNEGRINKITLPLGNSKSYIYDARGNVTQIVEAPPSGSLTQSQTTTFSFSATCANIKICNKPLSKTDAKANVTAYSWDANSGQITSETRPAVNGVSPVTRYRYTSLYAWISAGGGTFQHAGPPIWMLTQTRTCINSATVNDACSGGAADEVVTNYYYGPQAGPNNLEMRGQSTTSAGATVTTCFGYDIRGRRISETKPNANVSVCP